MCVCIYIYIYKPLYRFCRPPEVSRAQHIATEKSVNRKNWQWETSDSTFSLICSGVLTSFSQIFLAFALVAGMNTQGSFWSRSSAHPRAVSALGHEARPMDTEDRKRMHWGSKCGSDLAFVRSTMPSPGLFVLAMESTVARQNKAGDLQ